MADILLKKGSLHYHANRPWEIDFRDVEDILLPFEGTFVVPVIGPTPDLGFVDFYTYRFLSFRHVEGTAGQTATVPSLRDFRNRPAEVGDRSLFLIRDEQLLLDDFRLGIDLEQDQSFRQPLVGNDHVSGCLPFTLLLDLHVSNLPHDALPDSRNAGEALKGNGLFLQALPANFNGTLRAFDAAGMQIEAMAALRALGVDKPINGSLPPDDEIRLQFVDLHGEPLALDQHPLELLETSPLLQDDFSDHAFFRAQLPQPTANEFKLRLSQSLPAPATGKEYLRLYIYYHLWPGFSSSLRKLASVQGQSQSFDRIELFSGVPPFPQGMPPRFLRITLFHPTQEFQSEAGGAIQVQENQRFPDQLLFEDNRLQFFSEDNRVQVMNSGQPFLADFADSVDALQAGDRLYQLNWRISAHLHLKGSMTARGIAPLDADPLEVNRAFSGLVNSAFVTDFEEAKLLFLPSLPDADTQPFSLRVEVSSPTGKRESGFARAGHSFAWPLVVESGGTVNPHTALLYWKDSRGRVLQTAVDLDRPQLPGSLPPFPGGLVRLSVDEQTDPYEVSLLRDRTMVEIRTELGISSSLADHQIQLLIFNLKAGTHHIVSLVTTGGGKLAIDDDFRTHFFARDTLAIAVINGDLAQNGDVSDALLSSFGKITYTDQDHENGKVCQQVGEVAGLLRKKIGEGVEVKAVFWDQFLERIKTTSTAHSDNSEVTAMLNRVNLQGARGFAIRDRATRAFGAYHQKATAMVATVTPEQGDVTTEKQTRLLGYVGGIDLALGRWDTTDHWRRDPERQGGLWRDVQVKIDGMGVLDLLMNFKHRWKSIDAFARATDNADVLPVNATPEILAEVARPFPWPDPDGSDGSTSNPTDRFALPSKNAFVQVTRTVSPFSHHARLANTISEVSVSVDGELGSLECVRKAISQTRKFIVINDQYFFSQEIALLLHDALLRTDGPEFLILLLPLNLEEAPQTDPLMYAHRKRALEVLFNGSDATPGTGATCGLIRPRGPNSDSVHDRVAVLTPVNRSGDHVYVHSKHWIVDDVWMWIGSTNTNYRSMTHDFEINASIIGQKLVEGGTDQVVAQRIEILRQIMGWPRALSSALKDPYAVFRMLKQIEAEQEAPAPKVYPHPPQVRWLDKSFVAPFADGFVADLDPDDPTLDFFACGVLDTDGRNPDTDRLKFVAVLAGLDKFPVNTLVQAAVTFSAACRQAVSNQLDSGGTARLQVRAKPQPDDPGSETYQIASSTLSINAGRIQIDSFPDQIINIAVSLTTDIELLFQVIDQGDDVLDDCETVHVFKPLDVSPALRYGDRIPLNIVIDSN